MKMFLKWVALALLTLLIGGALYARFIVAPGKDAQMNAVVRPGPYKISSKARALHDSLRVADLHADTLLWARNPEKRHDFGQTDFPRLREGGVRLQVFSAVTKSPRGLNFNRNDGTGPDDITALAMAQFWPPRTWNSQYERAAYQARRLQKLEKRSKGPFVIARTAQDLKIAIENPDILVGILEIEGAHPLKGKIENIERLYDEGYRMMGLQHFFDNELGGSMHGISQAGLTDFGKAAIKDMTQRGIILDMAHASEASVRDVLALTNQPLILSHGGVRSACPRTKNRNLPDDILIEMARRGSLIGIGYFGGVICDISPDGIADALIYAVDLLGSDAVALGSDFDGTVTTSLDTSELAAITDALLDKDMEPDTVRAVMGENAISFFLKALP